jgi:hypothetical protein
VFPSVEDSARDARDALRPNRPGPRRDEPDRRVALYPEMFDQTSTQVMSARRAGESLADVRKETER